MKKRFAITVLLLLTVTFLAGCLGNQSTMDIGHVDRVEDTPRSMPEPTPAPDQAPTNITTSTWMSNITSSQGQMIQQWVSLMLPIMLLAPIIIILMSRFR